MSRIKTKDAELAAQLSNFLEVVTPSLMAQAGVSTAELTAVTNGTDGFKGTLETVARTESDARGAVEAKNASKSSVRNSFRVVVDKLYATPSITNSTLATLGLPPRPGTTLPTPPVTVTNVRGEANANGTARLRWSRNGNTSTTMFLVEASVDGSPFVQIAQTLRVSFTDPAATPGVPKTYRIVSFNALGRSAPSTAVTIYADGGEGLLEIAA